MASTLRRSQRNRAPVDYREDIQLIDARPLPTPRKRKPRKSTLQAAPSVQSTSTAMNGASEPSADQQPSASVISQLRSGRDDHETRIKLEKCGRTATSTHHSSGKTHENTEGFHAGKEAAGKSNEAQRGIGSILVQSPGIQMQDSFRTVGLDKNIVLMSDCPEGLCAFKNLSISAERPVSEHSTSDSDPQPMSHIGWPGAEGSKGPATKYPRSTDWFTGVIELVVCLTIVFFVLHILRSKTSRMLDHQAMAAPTPGFCSPDAFGEALLVSS